MAVDGATRRSSGNTFQPIARITAMAILARTLWLQGDTAGALAAARAASRRRRRWACTRSSCVALFWICPVAIWGRRARTRAPLGRRHAAGDAGARLRLTGTPGQRPTTRARARGVGRPAGQLAAVAERMPGIDAPRAEMLVVLREWIDDRRLERAGQGNGPWCRAEIFRAAGWRHERQGDAARAEACYRQALELARAGGAGLGAARGALAGSAQAAVASTTRSRPSDLARYSASSACRACRRCRRPAAAAPRRCSR